MFDKSKFCHAVERKGITLKTISEKINVNPSTLYRKMNGFSDFTRSEVQAISDILELDAQEIIDIFFARGLRNARTEERK